MRPSKLSVLCAVLLVSLFGQVAARGLSITYTFEGVVTEIVDARKAFRGVPVNSPIKVVVQFYLETPDSAPEEFNGSYANGITSLSVTLGSHTISQPNLDGWENVLTVEDNHPVYRRDFFGVSYVLDYSPSYPELIFHMALSAASPRDPFSSALPPSAIDLSQFETATIRLRDSFQASGSPLDIKATITSVTVAMGDPQ